MDKEEKIREALCKLGRDTSNLLDNRIYQRALRDDRFLEALCRIADKVEMENILNNNYDLASGLSNIETGSILHHELLEFNHKQFSQKVLSLAKYGRDMMGGKRGQGINSKLIDQELNDIISLLGLDSPANDVIERIEKLAEEIHDVWQDVDWEKGKIYFKDPNTRKEDVIKFKTIKNRIAKIKKKYRIS
jgi:hypothetical protein